MLSIMPQNLPLQMPVLRRSVRKYKDWSGIDIGAQTAFYIPGVVRTCLALKLETEVIDRPQEH